MLRNPFNRHRSLHPRRYDPRMKRLPVALATFVAATGLVVGCSSSDDGDDNPRSSTATSPSSAPSMNQRGAIEVDLGQPVTLTDDRGNLLVTITDSRLDATGCKSVDYSQIPDLAAENVSGRVQQMQFKASIRTGATETTQWLWSSDFYFVSKDGEVVDNLTVAQMHDDLSGTNCEGERSIIDLPPNSSARGATTLSVPIGVENGGPIAIGYKVEGKRAEWRLPPGWQPPAPSTSTETPAATTDAPAETTAPETTTTNGIPPGWDKDGNGQIDTDAPVG